ncbi:glyoxalase [Bacillus sp. FJAT-18017]|uniref:VOC family protein n=1 Tax=Bacillus sp. FJAT-18017 TaxID=1705566 RepID=UPI0006AE1559|nr:VOC family protein [Bacillus sp. FJAT-18017]ALC90529.1 glyoxalase [Bacillus sp. FJAT-18017]
MISRVGQIMLYVNNQDEAARFWTDVMGFTVISEENGQGMRWIEVAPSSDSETSFVLHDKEFIAKMEPDLNLGTPSLMLFTDDLEKLHSSLVEKGITVGEIVALPSGKVFNFADREDNYFAVMEKTK